MVIITESDWTMEKDMSDQNISKVLCPYIHKPFDDCYCASTSSLYTEATIRYCGGDFRGCSIYLKHQDTKGEKA
ncbi:MAG: hypothetical protein M0Z79_10160 [Nitrospiraceae bacterium]|nr:hypothetical protein [Nitrospiraceae bacterium]